jgi:CRP/FNR family transcriptional regulator
MLTPAQLHEAIALLPFLTDSTTPAARAFTEQATLMRFPAGTTVFEEGDICSIFTILATGQVRVFTIGETGREITLYRFARGESCILTTSCILSAEQFPAIATVEQDVEAYVVPDTAFHEWINTFQPWRTYIFQLLSRRLATVMAVLDAVAFRRMDARIAEFLLQRIAPAQPALSLTHQQIAADLGTSREVVSRILSDFADDGLVQIGRGVVTVIDQAGLGRRAEAR